MAKASLGFKFDDKELKKLLSSIKELNGASIDLGILAKDNKKIQGTKDTTLADVAMYDELGTTRSPARSFLRMPLMLQKKRIGEFVKSVFTVDALMNKKVKDLIGLVAGDLVMTVREAFNTKGFGNWKDNAKSTIQAKGFNNPNIWTGTLRDTINTEIKIKK